MKIANVAGRATVVTGPGKGVDVASASAGAYGPALPDLFRGWSRFRAWAAGITFESPEVTFTSEELVAAGLLAGHGWHGVAQADALVERGQRPELHAWPQGGLPDEQQGERAGGVHLVVGQHPQRFQLVLRQHLRFVDHDDGCATALEDLMMRQPRRSYGSTRAMRSHR